jgi:hypothetical protein
LADGKDKAMTTNQLTKKDRIEIITSDIVRKLSAAPVWSEKLEGFVAPDKSERSIVLELEHAIEIRSMTLTNNQFWATVGKIEKILNTL